MSTQVNSRLITRKKQLNDETQREKKESEHNKVIQFNLCAWMDFFEFSNFSFRCFYFTFLRLIVAFHSAHALHCRSHWLNMQRRRAKQVEW